MKRSQTSLGFTMIELLIALVIIGILSAIAIPSYMKSVRNTNRTEGQAELMNFAQQLQRCYTAYGEFTDPNCGIYMKLSDDDVVSQGSGFYRIEFDTAPTATAYTLKATAIKAPQLEDEPCQELTLTNTGVKAPEECW